MVSVRKKRERPNTEIERKFLVANDEWRQSAVRSVSIGDGLIAVYNDRKVRVRLSGDIATIAIKGRRIGIVRPEFELRSRSPTPRGCSRPCVKHHTLIASLRIA